MNEGLSEGSMQMGRVSRRALGPPGKVPFSWEDSRKCFDLVELVVTREAAAAVSVLWVWIYLPPGESPHEVQRQLRCAGPDAQQPAGFGSLYIPQILHPKP